MTQPDSSTPPAADPAAHAPRMGFARLILTCISARLLVDIGVQMFNPYLPIFAAGLKTDIVTMGRLVSLRGGMGLLAPLFGSLAVRLGYRRILRAALFASALGMWVIGTSPNAWVAAIGMVLIGLGLAGFTPTLQAYLSARLPYAQRARGMGMLEYSWALTGILGLSLMGQLIALTSWRVPFFLLGIGLAAMTLLFRSLPPAGGNRPSRPPGQLVPPWTVRLRDYFRADGNAASTYATITAAALSFFAAVHFMIIHGAWYADQYALGPRELGLVALFFGIFDLAASVSVSLFTDRFGKRRSVIAGTAGALLGYLAIPWLNIGIIPAVLATGLARGFFEFALVANLPLLSEQVPHRRAQIMTLSAAITLSSGTIASFVAPLIYTHIGVGGVAALSSALSAVALLLLLTRVRESAA